MSDAPKRRPWFQYHLSTAIVVMFVASGLLYLNVRPTAMEGCGDQAFQEWHGWPWTARIDTIFYQHGYTRYAEEDEIETARKDGWRPDIIGEHGWHLSGIIADSFAGLVLLFGVATACEWPIRRRERRP